MSEAARLLGVNVAWRWQGSAIRELRSPVLSCAATGGSRRDMQKIVARSRKRRARHIKRLNRRSPYDELAQELEDEVAFHGSVSGKSSEQKDEGQSGLEKDEPSSSKTAQSGKAEDSSLDSGSIEEDHGVVDMEHDTAETSSLPECEPRENDTDASGKSIGDEGVEELSATNGEQKQDSPIKVFVAGASGRTGRVIVEDLLNKGFHVRALVRNAKKARDLKERSNVELVEGDLYKYETLKKGLGDSNVVICATGSRFPLDMLGTYQVEYEGVLNLISAAKNLGKVKKFVFVTSIGASFFQLIPLLWWKRQAEIYLQRSGLDYTIVRPGGLREDGAEDENIIMRPADTLLLGGISRRKVAQVCVEAMVAPEASEKIVEVIAGGRTRKSIRELFSTV